MRTYLSIGIGGFLGAVSRLAVKNWQVFDICSPFPLSIFIINVAGCLALSFFLRLAFDIWELEPDMRLGISTGFIGAFTTFSTFCRDTAALLFSGQILFAAVNIIMSVSIGIAAVYLGDMAGKKLIAAIQVSGRK